MAGSTRLAFGRLRVNFAAVLLLGLTVRLLLAPFLAHPLDVYSWYYFSTNAISGKESVFGYLSVYHYAFFLFAFPSTLVFEGISKFVPSGVIPVDSLNPVLRVPTVALVPGMLYNLTVKIPLIASDAIVAFILYKIALSDSKDKEKASIVSASWFLNPVAIWVSSAWGTFDTLPALFTILALYLVLKGRFPLAAVLVVGAAALKAYAVVLVVPILILSFQKQGWRGVVRTGIGIAISSMVLYLPALYQSATYFAGLVVGFPSSSDYSGLSFWTTITFLLPPTSELYAISSIMIVVSLGIFYLLAVIRERPANLEIAASYFAIPILILLLLYRFVAENFFVWSLPFLAILMSKGIVRRKPYWFLNFIVLLSSVTNSLLPFYLLPLSPWIGNQLVDALGLVAPYRVAPSGAEVQGFSLGKAYLSVLGLSGAACLGIILFEVVAKTFRERRRTSESRNLPSASIALFSDWIIGGRLVSRAARQGPAASFCRKRGLFPSGGQEVGS